MKKVLGVFLGLLGLMIVGAIGILVLANSPAGPASDAAKSVKAAAANAVFDATDIKGQVKSTLDKQRDNIAAATGLTASEVDSAISSLDIESWKAAPLPSTATETGSLDGSSLGIDGSITTYSDPGYITLNAYGQNITLAVPESAQEYLPYLELAQG